MELESTKDGEMGLFGSNSVFNRAVCIAVLLLFCAAAAYAASENTQKPESYTETISGTLVKFDMVGIPAGEISLPDPAKEGAVCKVKIKPMWFGKTEVTWDEYDIFVFKLDQPVEAASDKASEKKDTVLRPSKPYGAADRGFGHRGYPVIDVSFLGARAYCKWLSEKTGHSYRLPTEAEWQYACLAGQPAPDKEQLSSVAWYFDESTHPVAKKKPNAWGLYDMLGNVAEWCTDLNRKAVVCGGSWQDMAKDISPSARKYQDESWKATDPQNPKSAWWLSDGPFVGFRIVRDDNGGKEDEQ